MCVEIIWKNDTQQGAGYFDDMSSKSIGHTPKQINEKLMNFNVLELPGFFKPRSNFRFVLILIFFITNNI